MIQDIDSDGEAAFPNTRSPGKRQISSEMRRANNDQPYSGSAAKSKDAYSVEDNEIQERIVADHHLNLLSAHNLLGRVVLTRWGRIRVYFFAIDLKNGRLLCYKRIDSKTATTYYNLSKGSFLGAEHMLPNEWLQALQDNAQQVSAVRQSSPRVRAVFEEPMLLQIQTKKGKPIYLELFPEKEVAVVKNYLQSCFGVREEAHVAAFKGYFATLGKGVLKFFKQPYRVASGILVSEEAHAKTAKDQKSLIKNTPHKIYSEDLFGQEQTKKKAKQDVIPVSGMFFGTSSVMSDILGGIAQMLHLENIGQNETSQAMANKQIIPLSAPQASVSRIGQQSINESMFFENDIVIGLVFKPRLGTIDIVVFRLNGEEAQEKKIYYDFFKVGPVPPSDQMKSSKAKVKRLAERQQREKALGIDDDKMFVVRETAKERLFVKRGQGYFSEADVARMKRLSQELTLDDVDATEKLEEDLQNDRELINAVLDYYMKRRPTMQLGTQLPQDDICEFLVICPTRNESAQQLQPVINLRACATRNEEEYEEDMDESSTRVVDENADLPPSYERISERYDNKRLPRISRWHHINNISLHLLNNSNSSSSPTQVTLKDTQSPTNQQFLLRENRFLGPQTINLQSPKQQLVILDGELPVFYTKSSPFQRENKRQGVSLSPQTSQQLDQQPIRNWNSAFSSSISTAPRVAQEFQSPVQQERPQLNNEYREDEEYKQGDTSALSVFGVGAHNSNRSGELFNLHLVQGVHLEASAFSAQVPSANAENFSSGLSQADQVTSVKATRQPSIQGVLTSAGEHTPPKNYIAGQINTSSEEEIISPPGVGTNANDIMEIKEEYEAEDDKEQDDEEEDEEKFADEDLAILRAKDDFEYAKITKKDLERWVREFTPFLDKDEVRVACAHKEGGKQNMNKDQVEVIRGVGKYMIGVIGRKILSGDFNLTQVSFPIKAMVPKSMLQTILYSTTLFPYYINRAASLDDKVERFRLLITAALGNFPVANSFLKPLNPILGETLEASYLDGTKL